MMLGKEAVETGEYDHLPLKYKWAKNKFFSCLKVLSLFLEFCLELISLTLYSKTWLITSDILTTIFCLFSSFLLSHCSKRLLSSTFVKMSTSSTLNHLKGGDQLLRTQLDLETSLKNMVKEFVFINSQQDCPKT